MTRTIKLTIQLGDDSTTAADLEQWPTGEDLTQWLQSYLLDPAEVAPVRVHLDTEYDE